MDICSNVLVAACEKKSILIFDVVTSKRTHTLADAHRDNVNCVKYVIALQRNH